METKKEIQNIKKQKDKFKRRGDLKMVAEYANTLGNLFSEQGDYRSAIDEHEQELMICQSLKDHTGEAIANRKLGECYMELLELDTALEYVNKYVNIAKGLQDKTELQRAYVTLGRLLLTECGSLVPNSKPRKESEKKTERAFMKALQMCEQIKPKLQSIEYQDMKARALVNLGLLANLRNEEKEATTNITNASNIARKHTLHGTLVMSLYHLAEVLIKYSHFADAATALDEAFQHSSHVTFKQKLDIIKLQAQASVEIGCVGEGLNELKTVMRKYSIVEREEFLPTAITLHKIVSNTNKLALSSDEDKCKLYEKLADHCCALGANYRAIQFYEKCLHIMNQLKTEHSRMAPILSSIAQTYQDVRNYEKAINYYCSEVKIQKQLQKFDQAARSLLNIAACMELQNASCQVIKKCYETAESHAVNANDPKLQVWVLKNYGEAMRSYGFNVEYDACKAKIESIKREFNLTSESQNDEESLEHDSSDGGFELSEDSDEETEAEVVRSSRCKPFKILKNELGETKLHIAVMKGKLDVVTDLIKKGHPIDVRDHAGWLPIHEAANHNQIEIAMLLIKHGSNINDRGGEQCMGVTPLHDACTSGHIEMIQLLIESGANVIAKENENRYPLDFLIEYRKNENDKLTEEQKTDLDEVEEMLRTIMIMKGITPKSKSFKSMQSTKDVVDNIPSFKAPTRGNVQEVDDDDVMSDEESCPPAPIPLSPEQTATEMYQSAVAHVRKSAKRLPVPRTSSIVDSKASEPALIRGENNLAASSEWLVDDYVSSPVKKKQKTGVERTKSQKSQRQRRSRRALQESPERLVTQKSPCNSPTASSPVICKSPSPSIEHLARSRSESPVSQSAISDCDEAASNSQLNSPIAKTQLDNNEFNCISPNPECSDHLSELVGELVPSSGMEKPKTSPGSDTVLVPEVVKDSEKPATVQTADTAPSEPENFSQVLMESAFEPSKNKPDQQAAIHCDENFVRDLDAILGEADDHHNKRSQPNSDPSHDHSDEDLDTPVLLNKSLASIFSQELDETIKEATQPKGADNEPTEWEWITGRLTPASPQASELNQKPETPQQFSFLPNNNNNDLVQPHNIPQTDSTNVNHRSRKCRRSIKEHMLDDLIGDKENIELRKAPPTSTPLRKISEPTSDKLKPNFSSLPNTVPQIIPTNASETKDSGFTGEGISNIQQLNISALSGRPLKEISDNITYNSMTFPGSKPDSNNVSFSQSLKILVQWKNRTLLIPVARSTTSIDWLTGEFVRRISRSKATTNKDIPPAEDIILTRATDRAELFNEDLVSEVLSDNEKVIAMSIKEL